MRRFTEAWPEEDAIRQRAVGGTDASNPHFEMLDLATPQVGESELLVKINAVGVGVHDAYFYPLGHRTPTRLALSAQVLWRRPVAMPHAIGPGTALLSSVPCKTRVGLGPSMQSSTKTL
ncbi:hypothetical protein GCM10023159_17790 [Brevibacterium yomogidense]